MRHIFPDVVGEMRVVVRYCVIALLLAGLLTGCATRPPGADYPKTHSVALTDFAATRFGRQFAAESAKNSGRSAFRIINVGVDGFLMRLEMIDSAERKIGRAHV